MPPCLSELALLQLQLEFEDGSRANVVSDESWKYSANGPIRANNEYDGEEYDALMEIAGWNQPGFDDGKWEAAKTVKIPIIGLGGISTAEDVIEFMLAGASAIEVGTVNFWDPCASETLVDSLEKWCLEHRVDKISELTGALEV